MEQETKEVKEALKKNRKALEYFNTRLRFMNNKIQHQVFLNLVLSLIMLGYLVYLFLSSQRYDMPLWVMIVFLSMYLFVFSLTFVRTEFAERDFLDVYYTALNLWATLSDDIDWSKRRDYQTYNDIDESMIEVIDDFYKVTHSNASPLKKSVWYMLCEYALLVLLCINSSLFSIIIYDLTTFVF